MEELKEELSKFGTIEVIKNQNHLRNIAIFNIEKKALKTDRIIVEK